MDTSRRDRGLRRVSRLTAGTLGGAVFLTGAFSALVAVARPGRAVSSSGANAAVTSPTSSNDFLQPPTVGPPFAHHGRAVVTSGAT